MPKTLDCTLRDGGYVNNWNFGHTNIKTIINNLSSAGIDYVECGFLKEKIYDEDQSLFSNINQLERLLPQTDTKFTLMINYGEYKDLPECYNKNIILRVAFHKNEYEEALAFCKQLKQKGYSIFVNPMHTNTYSNQELQELVKKVNSLMPEAFTIVDTTGSMKELDIMRIYGVIEKDLNPDIALCFHSHNNLQLSFSNAQCLLKICKNRTLIVDTTVFGIGRGAGNLRTELFTQYLNDNYNGEYNLLPILETVHNQINPIFAKSPWGYSVPYYLAAIHSCHPDYAKYLIKESVPIDKIDNILKSIPKSKKTVFDKEFIIKKT